jgi:hypothetical protein
VGFERAGVQLQRLVKEPDSLGALALFELAFAKVCEAGELIGVGASFATR